MQKINCSLNKAMALLRIHQEILVLEGVIKREGLKKKLKKELENLTR